LLVKRPSSLRPEGYSRYGKGGITPLLTGTFSISNCAWDAGVPPVTGATAVPFEPCDEVTAVAEASEFGEDALGLQATKGRLMTIRAMAAGYFGIFVLQNGIRRILTDIIQYHHRK